MELGSASAQIIRHSWLLALLVTFICMSPTLKNGWVNWDDEAYVLENKLLADVSPSGLQAIVSTPNIAGNYHPLTIFSLAIDYQVDGNNPFIYHLHNLLLHLLNVFLVYQLVMLLFKKHAMALIVSLLFGVHPMHIESVAWISARKDVLFAFYLLAALISYVKYSEKRSEKASWRFYALSILLFTTSMLAKSLAMTFPVLLLLIDYLQSQKNWKNLIFEKVPFFIITSIFIFITFYTQETEGAILTGAVLPWFDRIGIACYAIIFYLWKAIIPNHLSPFHPFPFQLISDVNWFIRCSVLIVPLLFFGLWKHRKSDRILVFGLLFFLVSISPVLQLIPFGRAMFAERYTYVSYIGLFILLAHLSLNVIERIRNRKKRQRTLITALLFSPIAVYSDLTFHQIQVWKNGETLWSKTIEAYPNDYFAYANRGSYYLNNKLSEAALSDLNKSIALYSSFAKAWHDRAIIYSDQGNYNLAHKNFSQAISLDSAYAQAYLNRALISAKQNNLDKAVEDLNKAIFVKPNYALAYLNRAVLLGNTGNKEKAILDYDQAIALEPEKNTYYRYRAVQKLELSDTLAAITDLSMAIKLEKRDCVSLKIRREIYLSVYDSVNAELDKQAILLLHCK